MLYVVIIFFLILSIEVVYTFEMNKTELIVSKSFFNKLITLLLIINSSIKLRKNGK